MTRWVSDGAAHPRRALFFRAQAPFVVVVVVLIILGFALGLTSHRDLWTGIAGGVIVLASVLALAVPWERMPPRATIVLPVLNLFAVAALSVEFHASIPTLPALAIFPAVWLATDHDGLGTLLGVIGGFVASVLPIAVMNEGSNGSQWLSALVIPVLVATSVVAASMMTRRTENARATLVGALRERDTAAAETARLGAALQSFARQVDVGIVIFDTAGTVMISNDAAMMFGDVARYDPEDGGGRYVYREDQVTRLPTAEQPLNRVLAGEVVQDLLIWVGPRGDQRALLANGAPVTSANGAAAGSFLVLHDLTEVIHASRERESALATLTHELRTPLTAIIGYLDMTELDELPAEAQKVAIATRNAEHMLALTSAFLNGLRPATGLALRRAAPAAIIREAVAAAQALPGADDRPFEVTCDDEDLVSQFDPDGIRQVMDNLLSNAVKFSEPGSTIRVSSQVDETAGMFCIVVANRGERLDDDELERIFDRFHRGSHARAQAVPGTGLGLTISRDIARRHGGSLAASRDDEGTIMTLRLPLVTDGAAAAGAAGAARA